MYLTEEQIAKYEITAYFDNQLLTRDGEVIIYNVLDYNNLTSNAWEDFYICADDNNTTFYNNPNMPNMPMMNNQEGVQERVVHRTFVHEVPHVCPIHTRIINHHVYRHTYRPEYSCCEENVVSNINDGNCSCFK